MSGKKRCSPSQKIKLLHAQVNPHFLFNALNTIKAVIRRDSEQASQLVQYLSTFFRKNLSGLRSLLLSPTKLNM